MKTLIQWVSIELFRENSYTMGEDNLISRKLLYHGCGKSCFVKTHIQWVRIVLFRENSYTMGEDSLIS